MQVELVPLPGVSGIVRDAENGTPLAEFTVRLRQQVPNSAVPLPVRGTRARVSDSQGSFRLPVPKAGTYQVEALADGYAMCFSSSFIVTAATESPVVVVDMTRGGSIRGLVVDPGGRPLSGARVTTHDKSWSDDELTRAMGAHLPTLAVERTVHTNGEGIFVVDGLTPTEYRIEVSHPSYTREIEPGVLVVAGSLTDAGKVQLREGGVVSGIVRDLEGQALAGAVVKLVTPPGAGVDIHRSFGTQTDSQGLYELRQVSAGNYVIVVRRSAEVGLNPFQDREDDQSAQRQVMVTDGEHQDGVDFAVGELGGS